MCSIIRVATDIVSFRAHQPDALELGQGESLAVAGSRTQMTQRPERQAGKGPLPRVRCRLPLRWDLGSETSLGGVEGSAQGGRRSYGCHRQQRTVTR
jgi:hypothetical protein